jgi:hypothetical protein
LAPTVVAALVAEVSSRAVPAVTYLLARWPQLQRTVGPDHRARWHSDAADVHSHDVCGHRPGPLSARNQVRHPMIPALFVSADAVTPISTEVTTTFTPGTSAP